MRRPARQKKLRASTVHDKTFPMTSFSALLIQDHRRCDDLFARTVERISRGDWTEADHALTEFIRAMEHHLRFEEENLFPAFEQAMGNRAGPTQATRQEHEQMRALFRDMQECLRQRDVNRYLGVSETLLILMKQHNMKEEHILYHLADQALGEQGPALAARFIQS
jgi:hemerythrin-like domain-containing protein